MSQWFRHYIRCVDAENSVGVDMIGNAISVRCNNAELLTEAQGAIEAVRWALTDNLLKPEWRRLHKRSVGRCHAMAGHCYVASEALYHLLGGKAAGLKPMTIKMGPVMRIGLFTHWYLVTNYGSILDPTGDQFASPAPYHLGKGRGFLPRHPSARAQAVIDRVESRQKIHRGRGWAG